MVKINNLPKILQNDVAEDRIADICKSNDVMSMAIFGSFVRGENDKESDIDVAIKYREGSNKSLLDLIRLEMELEQLWSRKVDLGIYDSLNPYIIDEVNREMKVIYEER